MISMQNSNISIYSKVEDSIEEDYKNPFADPGLTVS
jgi:hypothetical protein